MDPSSPKKIGKQAAQGAACSLSVNRVAVVELFYSIDILTCRRDAVKKDAGNFAKK